MNQTGDLSGIWGFFLWFGSALMTWMNQNVSGVIALTAIGGLMLSAFSAWIKWKHWQQTRRSNDSEAA